MFPYPRVLAALLSAALPWVASPGPPANAPLGILTLAERAHLDEADAFPGLSVFEGERLSTDAKGRLGMRVGRSTLGFSAQTQATLVALSRGVHVDLDEGGVAFATAENERVEVHADGALVQPESSQATNGSVVILGPKILQVSAAKGGLSFTYQEEFRNLPEGQTYRIYLDAPAEAQDVAGAGATSARPGSRRKVAYFIMGTGMFGLAGWLMQDEKKHKHPESPDKP